MVNKEKIVHFLDHPEDITWEDISWLEKLSKEYPYFQTIKVIIARHYIKEDHLLKSHKIHNASTFAVNRPILRKRLFEKKGPKTTVTTEKSEVKEIIEVVEKEDIIVKVPTKEEKNREELLLAIHDRLAELEKNKANALENLEATKPSSTLPEIEIVEEKQVEIASFEITEINTFKEEITVEKEENKEPVETQKIITPEIEQVPVEIEKKSRKEKLAETKLKKEEKLKREAELKAEEESLAKPDNLFYSRLGNELNIDSTDSVDLLLNYLESQKEKKKQIEIELPAAIQEPENIIEKFIKNDPKISKLSLENKLPIIDLSESKTSKNKFISENLAKIQAKQGYIQQAIDIYQELILKYPEKKTYFADEIKKLK